MSSVSLYPLFTFDKFHSLYLCIPQLMEKHVVSYLSYDRINVVEREQCARNNLIVDSSGVQFIAIYRKFWRCADYFHRRLQGRIIECMTWYI